jgi:uncharacterized membrane protein YkoI
MEAYRQQSESSGMRQTSLMNTILKRLAMVGLSGFVLCWPLLARADMDEDGDHDRARDLYERGEIKGLSNILSVVHAKAPGEIVAVDFIRIGDRWVYRFQIIAADGRRKVVDVDAGAGVLMRGEGGDQ